MKIISFLHVPFAVRSGGHSPNPYFASIGSNGILISTTNLNSITVSSDNSIASIGPGLRCGAVYKALDPYGVSVIGGRIPQVGVGGLILGGMCQKLAADNVKSFEVVLASGEIVNANAAINSDLFWALKGGGPNFVYSEPATYPDAFAPFAAIPNGIVSVPPMNATVTLLSSILFSAFVLPLHVYRSAASLIDETLYNETSSYFLDTINGLQADGVDVNMTFTLQTIPPSLVAAGEARRGKPNGYPI
ncbi:hypothetical protein SBOR_1495 [Sclerotinia borealis F-4128]|uniref:FAD-binding PCMH-type domain-containing protein n=1 Tax=Sclerotinia borealis (strain F-4128) TaxID=1432307 RepID=W9CQI8_SCLBF|nr:hypothetical protein SBOR_1495 [Sclerotinia borealis F-4128]